MKVLIKNNGQIIKYKLIAHQVMSKSLLKAQNAMACKPEQKVKTREIKA
jgi:hypothetical protein